MTYLVRVVESRAVWGFVVSDGRVLECAPYGRRRVGRTATSARRFLRGLRREQWAVIEEQPGAPAVDGACPINS